MNPIVLRNLTANKAKQRQLDAVQSAASNLAQAISNAIRPDLSKLSEIRTAITNEYQRCENLRTPTTNVRDRAHLAPEDDPAPVNNGRKPPVDRTALAPKGE